jgi:hypothetical protein
MMRPRSLHSLVLVPAAALTLAALPGCVGSGTTPGVRPPAAGRTSSSAVTAASLAAAPSAGNSTCGWRNRSPGRYDHVLWVVLENHSTPALIGRRGSAVARRSPYLNALARRCGLATNYHALTHPSLANYLALVSGSTGGVRPPCTPAECPQRRPTLFDQLRSRGLDWRVYAEAMPAPCHRSDSGRYVVRHNPPTYFPSVAACASHDVPLGTTSRGRLVDDLAADELAAFSIVVPDQCHNTHDCPIASGDRWLSRMVPRVLASPAYRAGRTALVVTWDEGKGGLRGQSCRRDPDRSCHIVTVVVSPTTRPGTRSGARYDHYSLLEATSRMLGVPTLLGHAADRRTRDLRPAFGL